MTPEDKYNWERLVAAMGQGKRVCIDSEPRKRAILAVDQCLKEFENLQLLRCKEA